ncbi:zinc protease [Ereboglobus sp. PH5-10]|uniref:M16 family metallopeptidase n=1 Tax=Ereboglobus sp. PH5-10 TaxID=2940629 RepID=UPI002406FF72|nr:insulinase family protein [Ereboglobus sp. PH5-10]MDF9826767.1 zinc protease [Ereboglobus sp. PH5-10]
MRTIFAARTLAAKMPPRRHPLPRVFTLLAALIAIALPAHLAKAAPWANLETDLPQDPALVLGELPNGFRYALLPNAEPANRVSLRLLVSVGSIHENDNERGIAHFIEHMAFRGTRNKPGGGLIAELERMGVSFGPDHTAFTSFNNTIYHLELPDVSKSTLREGLRVFREYASGIEFAPGDIELERGVILSEMATRDTGMARAGQRYSAFIWPSARENSRSPIGVEKQIRRFTQKQFRAFYDAWYRPERMALIAVGQIDPDALRAMIADEFSPLAARAPARPEPPPPSPRPASRKLPAVGVFTHNELTGMGVMQTCAWAEPPAPFTREKLAEHTRRNLALSMFTRRLTLRARQPGAPFGAPNVEYTQLFPGLRMVQFAVPGDLNKTDIVIAAAEQSLRAAIEHGFTQGELDEAKADLVNRYRQGALYAPSRKSAMLASQLAYFLLNGEGFCTPETTWREVEKPIADATLAECNAAFAKLWSRAPVRTFINGNIRLLPSKPAAFEKKLAASRAIPVKPPAGIKALDFAYTDFGKPGRIAETKTLPEIDAHLVRFENNILLNFKHTEYEKDYVLINLRIGHGKREEPKNVPGIGLLASKAFLFGGLGRHTAAEITHLNARHLLDINFTIADDAAHFYAQCPVRSLPYALQMMTAFITDAAYRPESFVLARPDLTTLFQHTLSSPSANLNAICERALTRDTRFGWPNYDEPASRTVNELREWLVPLFTYDDIELSIVGDVDLQAALDAAAGTLGALPVRAKRLPPKPNTGVAFAPAPSAPIVINVNPALKQGAFLLVWPVPDAGDTHQDRARVLLADALDNAVRLCIREQLGAAYVSSAAYATHDGFDNFNYLFVGAEVDRGSLDKAINAVRKTIARIAANGFSDDEFLRAKRPFVEHYDQQSRTNAYWGYTVLRDIQNRPERLTQALTRLADVSSITRDEINAIAARHLRDDTLFLFKTAPAKK